VNMHKNARLTPVSRERAVKRVLGGEKPSAVANSVDVSRQTVFKWVRRWRREGRAGLLDRSSRPMRSPQRVRRVRERQVLRLRGKRWSTVRIAEALKLPLSTVGAVCRRHDLGRLPELEPPIPVVRYQWDRPGQMIHLDTKKLARIERIGHRIHGDRARKIEGAGWEFLHVCVDDATRVTHAEVLPDERKESCAGFLSRVLAWYTARGIKIERVMTDNGSGYRSKLFRRVIEACGARQVFTRPYTPRTNGKAERFIQTCKRDWAYARPYRNSNARTAALAVFLCFYNCHRPHWGIGRKTPQLRFRELVNNVPGCNT
jgi:transposase InsO family protein